MRRARLANRTLAIQSLEQQTVLAGNLTDGVLTVEGCNGADTIRIRSEGEKMIVEDNGERYDFATRDIARVAVTSGRDS